MRHHAPLLTSIWDDDDFCALSAAEQRLYMQLLSQKRLSIVGVIPYSPKNWTRGCADITIDEVLATLDQLVAKRYVLIDPDTEELLVRTILKHDPPRGWKSIRGMWNAWLEVDSKPLRRAILEHVTDEIWATPEAPPPEAAKVLRNTPFDDPSMPLPMGLPSRACPTTHHPPSTTSSTSTDDIKQSKPTPVDEEEQANPRRSTIATLVAKKRAALRNDIGDMTRWVATVRTDVLAEHGAYIDRLIVDFNPAPDDVLAAAVLGDKHSLGYYRTPTLEETA